MGHVEEEPLLAFTLGQLEGEAASQIEAHLATCEACRTRQEGISSAAFSKTAVGSSKDGVPTRAEGGSLATNANGLVLQRGATLGRYVMLEKLGAGGMGEVFAAYDPHLDRKVALKLLRGGALSAEEGKVRLLREAQAMARLQHPNVIGVHDVGLFGERVFVAMEYVEGETLADWLRGQHPWEDVIRIFMQAGDGLSAAHRAGLVHRDFKPDNVLLGADARPRVVDFGLARQSTSTPAPASHQEVADGAADSSLNVQLTRDGAVMGTPGYMAPEQIAGLLTDARSDQFSFCVALWEGLFGKRPFSGATLRQHAQEIAAGRLTPVPADTKVPDWVRDVLKRGLAANPADRWPEMDALIKALRPRARRNYQRTIFVTGLVLFSIFGIGYGMWTRQRLLVCGGTERRLTGLWDSARKAKLREGFKSTGLSYAGEAWASTERSIDTWAAEWVVTAREVCEAAQVRKVDSPEAAALKSACLDERVERLEALVALFDAPDHDVVNNAPTAARELESATSCTTTAGLHRHEVADEKEKAADLLLHTRLAEARNLFAAGKYAAGIDRLQGGLSPGAPAAAQAEGYLFLARLELKMGDNKLARQANLVATEQALKSGEAGLAARGLSRLYANEGYDEPDSDADAWGRLAAAAAARVPGDWEVQVELGRNDGFVDLRRKRYKAALADFEGVLALQQEHLGSEHPEVASTLNNLGIVLTRLEREEEAVARYEESLRIHEKLEGPEHPNVAVASQNLAVALKRLNRFAEARVAFERALQIRRKALGFNHPESLRSAQSLVKLLIALGDLEAARTLLDEVKETRTLMSGADSVEMLSVLECEAELFLAGDFWGEALQTANHHLAIAKARGPAGEKEISTAMLEQVAAWTQLGSWAEARRALTEVQRRRAAGDLSLDQADISDALGRLELAQGHAELAVAPLQVALDGKTKNGGLGAARTELVLAQALLHAGKPAEALPLTISAEGRFPEISNPALLLDVQVAKAQAMFLSAPEERGPALVRLAEVMPQLSEARRQPITEWIKKQGAVLPDAGVP